MSCEDTLPRNPRKRRDGSSRHGWRWFAAMPGGTQGREPGRHREERSSRGRIGAVWIFGRSDGRDRRHLRPEPASSSRPTRRRTRPSPTARGRSDDQSLPSEDPFAPTGHKTWQPVAGREDVPRVRSTSSLRPCASERPHVVRMIDQQGHRPLRTDLPTARTEGRFVHALLGCHARRASIVEAAEVLSQVSAPRSWTMSAAGCRAARAARLLPFAFLRRRRTVMLRSRDGHADCERGQRGRKEMIHPRSNAARSSALPITSPRGLPWAEVGASCPPHAGRLARGPRARRVREDAHEPHRTPLTPPSPRCRGARANGEREEHGQLPWEARSTEAPRLARPHSAEASGGGGGLAPAEASDGGWRPASAEASGCGGGLVSTEASGGGGGDASAEASGGRGHDRRGPLRARGAEASGGGGGGGDASAEASGGRGHDRRLTAPDGPLRARGWDDETNRLLGEGSPGGSRRTR
jgi:hypothetical protein